MYINLFDSHTHSDNSPDGTHSVTYLCEKAEENGLLGFALTDHCECDLFDDYSYETSLRQSIFEAKKCKSVFSGRLHVSTGVELGQPTQNYAAAEKILSLCNYDFILASLHNARGRKDFYYVDFNDPTIVVRELLEPYFSEYIELAKWNKFDSVGHITYPLRYLWGKFRIPVDMKPYNDYIDEFFKLLAANGKGIEINTSGIRQGLGFTLPTLDYIKRFKELGGEIVTLGSDAHFGEHMGKDIGVGMDMLKEAGFDYFAFFKERKPVFLKII